MNQVILRIILFILFQFSAFLSIAQDWTNYPSVDMKVITMDTNEVVWGTNIQQNKLVKFEGGIYKSSFLQPSKFSSHRINDILLNGKFTWIGTSMGIFRILDKDTVYFGKNNSGLSNDTCNALFEYKKAIYALSNSTLYKYENGIWNLVLSKPKAFFQDLAIASDSIYLTSTNGFYVSSLTGTLTQKTYYGTYQDFYDHVKIDSKGVVWFHNWWSLFRYSNGKIELSGVENFAGYSNAGFEDIAIDSQDNIWMAWGKQGVTTFLNNKNLTVYNQSNSNIISDNTHSLVFGRNKIYVGTYYGLSARTVPSILTSLVKPIISELQNLKFKDYNLLGVEIMQIAPGVVFIRQYESGFTEKRCIQNY